MTYLYYFMIDAPRYVCLAAIWRLSYLLPILSAPKWVHAALGDYAFWDDPWVQYQRWTRRGYDMEWMRHDQARLNRSASGHHCKS